MPLESIKPLWITYAWKDNEEGDFDYLVQELKNSGVNVIYDKVAIIPGQRLWDQIAAQITSPNISGWACLITQNSLNSQPCREELSYAMQQVMESKDGSFPLIGLTHDVPFSELPPAFRTRLCISMKSNNWIDQIKSALTATPLSTPSAQVSPYIVKIHRSYLGVHGHTAIEITPRFGEIRNWRVGVHSDAPQPVDSGSGGSGGGGISGAMFSVVRGHIDTEIGRILLNGAEGPLTSNYSAYIIFNGAIPTTIYFGSSKSNSTMIDTLTYIVIGHITP